MQSYKISRRQSDNPSSGMREYHIILSLPNYIINEVKNIKSDFSIQYGNADRILSPAHITLSYFAVESTPEDTIRKELQQRFVHWKSFNILISDFDKFQNNRTLYLKVSKEDIIKLQNYMQAVLRQRVKVGKKYTQKLETPHITIASYIPEDTFEGCWYHFKDKSYKNNFTADRITVLRRNVNETSFTKAFEIRLKP